MSKEWFICNIVPKGNEKRREDRFFDKNASSKLNKIRSKVEKNLPQKDILNSHQDLNIELVHAIYKID